MLLKVDLIANRTQSGHAIQQSCDNELLVKIISDGIIKGQKRDNATILREADSSIWKDDEINKAILKERHTNKTKTVLNANG